MATQPTQSAQQQNGRTAPDLPTPATKAAMRLTQLYHNVGDDGALSVTCLIVAGRLVLVVDGRTEDLGVWKK